MRKNDNLKNLKKELDKTKAQAEEFLNNWKRAQADYLNFKRRIEEEKKETTFLANKNLILQLLPVMDNFQRAFRHIPNELKDSNWVLGIKQLEQQLINIIKNEGLEKIPTVGSEFNPDLHEAVLLEEKKNTKKGIILEELEAGYKLKDKVIKPAKVKVAK